MTLQELTLQTRIDELHSRWFAFCFATLLVSNFVTCGVAEMNGKKLGELQERCIEHGGQYLDDNNECRKAPEKVDMGAK